jgi:hypothetical protein
VVKFLLPLKVLRVRDINSSNHIEAAAENTLNIAFNSLFTSHGSFSLSNAGCSSYIYIYIYIYNMYYYFGSNNKFRPWELGVEDE